MRRVFRLHLQLTPGVPGDNGEPSGEHLPGALAARLIAAGAPLGVQRVRLWGHHLEAYPDLSQIASACREQDMGLELAGEGHEMFALAQALERAGATAPAGIRLLLRGACEATHDHLSVDGSFRRAMQAASYCFARKVPLDIVVEIEPANRSEIAEVILLAAALRAERVVFALPRLAVGGVRGRPFPPPNAVDEHKRELERLREAFRLEVNLDIGLREPDVLLGCRSLCLGDLSVNWCGQLTLCQELWGPDSGDGSDVVADLHEVTLPEAVKELIARITTFRQERLRDWTSGGLVPLDRFFCYYCHRRFGKLRWTEQGAGRAWAPRQRGSTTNSPGPGHEA